MVIVRSVLCPSPGPALQAATGVTLCTPKPPAGSTPAIHSRNRPQESGPLIGAKTQGRQLLIAERHSRQIIVGDRPANVGLCKRFGILFSSDTDVVHCERGYRGRATG